MINVPIDKIVPLTTARDTLSKIVAEVETNTPMYVLTKGGKPSVAVVNIDYLEKALNGQLVTGTTDDSIANQDVHPEQTSEAPSATQDQQSIENALEPTIASSTESLPEPPVDEPSQPPAETPDPSLAPSSDFLTSNDQSPPSDEFSKTLPAPTSQPADQPTQSLPPTATEFSQSPSAPSTSFNPSTPSNPTTQPKPNIALGSMDGIQPQPFVPPPPATKPIDKNYTPNPAQYAGPTDPQTGAGNPNPADLPDMVID